MTAPATKGAVVYAGFWIRSAAAVVDIILSGMILYPVLRLVYGREYFDAMFESAELVLAGVIPSSAGSVAGGPVDLILTYVVLPVAVILFWIYREATPGKMLVRARIVDAATGAHPSARQLIIRYFGYYVSILPLGLGLIWVAIDPRKQGFHDKLARTVVIRRAI